MRGMLGMPKYNLDALGHEEFERLCQSLIQQIVGPGAKIYGMGKDGSREATFQGKAPYPSKENQWDGSWIFQAKFHDVQQIGPKEARRRVLIELKDELFKVTEKYKHPCDNYILLTNVPLTPVFKKGMKDRIDNEITPKFRNAIRNVHVWGADEISRFLDVYPSIRQAYSHLLVSGDVIFRLTELIEKEAVHDESYRKIKELAESRELTVAQFVKELVKRYGTPAGPPPFLGEDESILKPVQAVWGWPGPFVRARYAERKSSYIAELKLD
jgi:hypothetical protein